MTEKSRRKIDKLDPNDMFYREKALRILRDEFALELRAIKKFARSLPK